MTNLTEWLGRLLPHALASLSEELFTFDPTSKSSPYPSNRDRSAFGKPFNPQELKGPTDVEPLKRLIWKLP